MTVDTPGAHPTGRAGPAGDLPAAPYHRLPNDPEDGARAFWLTAEDDVRLRACVWRDDMCEATVLLFTGRTEYCEKYAGLGRDLVAQGFALLTVDWRGQGLSDRLIDDPRPGHVEDFEHYQRDVDAMLAAADTLMVPGPRYLLAHSMGGAIAMRALDRGIDVRAVGLVSPMMAINFTGFARAMGAALPAVLGRLKRPEWVVPGARSGGTYVTDAAFYGNQLTHSAAVWGRLVEQAARWPELTLGNPTFGWVAAALKTRRHIDAMTPPAYPTWMCLGSDEEIVAPDAIRRIAERWPQAQLRKYEGGRHEMLVEAEPVRNCVLGDLLTHFRTAGDRPLPNARS